VPGAVPSPPAVGRETLLRRLAIWVALYGIPISVIAAPVLDWDIWWHLRAGQWVVEHRTVPQTDPFSSYGEGHRWIAYSWLFELLVAGLYAGLGLTGILIYRAVVGLALFAAVQALIVRRVPHFFRAALLTAVAFFALAPVLSERSWLFSLLFYTLTLDAVLGLREGRVGRVVWLLPLLYALGANLHIQFVNGLALLGLACAAPVIDRVFRLREPDDSAATAFSRAWWRLVAVTGLCAAATLVNPYHVRLYLAVIELPTQSGAYQYIQELQPLSFRVPSDWVVLGLFAVAVFVLGRRGKASAFDLLLMAGSAYLTFHARRELWTLVLASVAVLVERRGAQPPEAERFPLTGRRALVVAAGAAAVFAGFAWYHDLSEGHLREQVGTRFPEAACRFVEGQDYGGPMYTTYGWGGFLMWRLPRLKPNIDGRANLHGSERIERTLRTDAAWPGWDRDPDLMSARLVIVPANHPLVQVLERDPRFHRVYKDHVAFVSYNPDPPGPAADPAEAEK
ncbi:MAG TPA: hypothetical protein VFW33_05835, partial [Gemmataceae bacterium]|nr:hypothetical protein [Gemmataceae bacterium]